MGLFDNLFSRDSKQEKKKVELYRANLFQKNIASQIEADSLEIAISFQHSLVNISAELFTIETLNGEHYSLPINFSEKDFSTTTYKGKFQNGRDFRLIQPTDLSLDMAKSNHNALGAFTLGSVNPSGWAVHFFLTDKDDIRQTNVSEKGSTEQIQKLIQVGIDEGAKLVAGGKGKPEGLDKGYFVKPTAFADVNNKMQIARTEIFGPVLSIIPFETEEEAIEIANDTPYGLLNFIQTQDQEKANRVARKLRSGMVDINGAGLAPDAPFGGYKHSGIGREAGKLGLEEYLEVKVVSGWND